MYEMSPEEYLNQFWLERRLSKEMNSRHKAFRRKPGKIRFKLPFSYELQIIVRKKCCDNIHRAPEARPF